MQILKVRQGQVGGEALPETEAYGCNALSLWDRKDHHSIQE
jgi:hypothetical protein